MLIETQAGWAAAIICAAALLANGAIAAVAHDFPNKPMRILVTGIGGGADTAARLIAQKIAISTGQQLVVDNRPSGVIPGQVVAQASPDGYTLLFAGGTFSLAPLLQNAPYDPLRDFVPITQVSNSPNLLVIHPSLPVNSVADLIALAKSKPGQLNYASSGSGSTPHLAAELFKSMAGVDIVRVNYRGTAPAITDLLANQVQLAFSPMGSVAPHVKAARLKALAVTSAQPSILFAGLPTVAASGLPGYELGTMYGVLAPARTPVAVVNRLNQEIVAIVRMPDVREKMLGIGLEPVGSTPAQLTELMKADMARLGKVIKAVGIHAD